MLRTSLFPLLVLLAVNGCGESPNEPGPGGVSAEDAKALDEAAAKLDSETANPPK